MTSLRSLLSSTLAVSLAAATLSGCVVQRAKDKGVAFLEVHLSDPGSWTDGTGTHPGPGTEAAPMPMPRSGYAVKVSVTAMDVDGQPMDCAEGHGCYEGKVAFTVTPGWLPVKNPNTDAKKPEVPATRGQLTATLSKGKLADFPLNLKGVYSTVHVWAEEWPDEAPNTSGTTLPRTGEHYATGASEPLFFKFPTLQDLQYNPASMGLKCFAPKVDAACDSTTSPLVDNFIQTQPGRFVVTGITAEGFFVTDLGAEPVTDKNDKGEVLVVPAPGRFNSLFVFNFSYPDNLLIGDMVNRLFGTVQEFTGDTQITFPSWEKETTALSIKGADGQLLEGKSCESGADCPVAGFSCDTTQCAAGEKTCAQARCRANGSCRAGFTGPDGNLVPVDYCPEGFQCEAGGCRLKPLVVTEEHCAHALSSGNNPNLCGDNTKNIMLESMESDRVELTEAYMPTEFMNCDFNGDGDVPNKNPNDPCNEGSECDCKLKCIAKPGCSELSALHSYGQYALTMKGGKKFKINVISRDSSPTVIPTLLTQNDPVSPTLAYAGVRVRVRGNLRQSLPARPKWTVVAGEKQDFCCLESDARKCLELPKCEGVK